MKLPNGYGSCYKLSGKRRKPWIVRISKGWTPEGKAIYGILGYYKTKAEGLQALAAYHENPVDLEAAQVTFEILYRVWYKTFFSSDDKYSKRKNYEKAYNACTRLFKLKIADIKKPLLQLIINEYEETHVSGSRLKTLWKQMFDFCVENEWLKKNPAADLRVRNSQTKEMTVFTHEEIKKVREAIPTHPYARLIMIMIYTGCRIGELLDLKKEDLHLEERWFYVRDAKTKAGIRHVPIHEGTVAWWQWFLERSRCDYVFTTSIEGIYLEYSNFRRRYWVPLMAELELDHHAHETRHTFITLLAEANINVTLIKKIVGHKSSQSLTEAVYTHPQLELMKNAVNKLRIC